MEAFEFLKHRVGRILELKATRSEEKDENIYVSLY
jgi:hypothetical protein